MVTITDIVKSINKQLKEVYPEINIQSTDVKEGYQRPCFYVDIVDFGSDLFMDAYNHKTAAFNVYYFPSAPNNHRLELLEVREKLQDAFIGYLDIVQDFKIHILDTDTSINDGVLSFEFEIEYFQQRKEKDNHGKPIEGNGENNELSYMESVEIDKL